ncbi:hypothetical protein E2320_003016 [Naja naja]|nr:hypothetical protein E2320_003016 [Naja naja]
MGLIAMMLLVFLFCATCKSYAINCSILDNPLPIPHHFAQLGNVIIGAIISQAFVFHNNPSFTEDPSQTLINELLVSLQKIVSSTCCLIGIEFQSGWA